MTEKEKKGSTMSYQKKKKYPKRFRLNHVLKTDALTAGYNIRRVAYAAEEVIKDLIDCDIPSEYISGGTYKTGKSYISGRGAKPISDITNQMEEINRFLETSSLDDCHRGCGDLHQDYEDAVAAVQRMDLIIKRFHEPML